MSTDDVDDVGHGNSPAAWTAVVIMLVAFSVGTIAFFFSYSLVVWISAAFVIIGLIVGQVLARLGYGVGGSRVTPQRPLSDRITDPVLVDLLSELTAGALADAATRRQSRPLAEVERAAMAAPAALDAAAALRPIDRVRIIAEVKRASPSRGALAAIPDPAVLARSYRDGGASAISVLTEGRRFGGSLDDLAAVRAAVDLPVLRKDFIAEPYQVFEAREAGADLVLLIVAALGPALLSELFALVGELGMTALVEAHSAEEVARAVDLGAGVIGVNARDLSTFELDRDLFGRLAPMIPDGVTRVAESAVTSAADVAHYRSAGAHVVLVGEALVTGNPVATLREFLDS